MTTPDPLPNEAQIIAALRAQWHRAQASAAHRAGALVELRIVMTASGTKVEVAVHASESLPRAKP